MRLRNRRSPNTQGAGCAGSGAETRSPTRQMACDMAQEDKLDSSKSWRKFPESPALSHGLLPISESSLPA